MVNLGLGNGPYNQPCTYVCVWRCVINFCVFACL